MATVFSYFSFFLKKVWSNPIKPFNLIHWPSEAQSSQVTQIFRNGEPHIVQYISLFDPSSHPSHFSFLFQQALWNPKSVLSNSHTIFSKISTLYIASLYLLIPRGTWLYTEHIMFLCSPLTCRLKETAFFSLQPPQDLERFYMVHGILAPRPLFFSYFETLFFISFLLQKTQVFENMSLSPANVSSLATTSVTFFSYINVHVNDEFKTLLFQYLGFLSSNKFSSI